MRFGIEKLRGWVSADLQELLNNPNLSRGKQIIICRRIVRTQDQIDDRIDEAKRLKSGRKRIGDA